MVPAAAEVARLVVAISVIPLLMNVSRSLRMEKTIRPAYVILIGLIYVSYVLTVVESLVAEQFFNAVQHLCLGGAGIAAIVVAWEMRNDILSKRES